MIANHGEQNDRPITSWVDEQRQRSELALLNEVTEALTRIRQQEELRVLDAASHLAAGTYGYCADCHRAIPIERLERLPFSVRCASCDRRHRLTADQDEPSTVCGRLH